MRNFFVFLAIGLFGLMALGGCQAPGGPNRVAIFERDPLNPSDPTEKLALAADELGLWGQHLNREGLVLKANLACAATAYVAAATELPTEQDADASQFILSGARSALEQTMERDSPERSYRDLRAELRRAPSLTWTPVQITGNQIRRLREASETLAQLSELSWFMDDVAVAGQRDLGDGFRAEADLWGQLATLVRGDAVRLASNEPVLQSRYLAAANMGLYASGLLAIRLGETFGEVRGSFGIISPEQIESVRGDSPNDLQAFSRFRSWFLSWDPAAKKRWDSGALPFQIQIWRAMRCLPQEAFSGQDSSVVATAANLTQEEASLFTNLSR